MPSKFCVNNNSDFTPKGMTGEKVFVEWEKYNTVPTSVTDEEVRYLAYDKRGAVCMKYVEAFKMSIRDHVIWKIVSSDNASTDMPIVCTTGGQETVELMYLETVKKLNLSDERGLNIVLCPEHATELTVDKDSAKSFATNEYFSIRILER